MPRVQWPLLHGHPVIEVVLTLVQSGQQTTRTLLADTGAGRAYSPFELILKDSDCLLCGGIHFGQTVQLLATQFVLLSHNSTSTMIPSLSQCLPRQPALRALPAS